MAVERTTGVARGVPEGKFVDHFNEVVSGFSGCVRYDKQRRRAARRGCDGRRQPIACSHLGTRNENDMACTLTTRGMAELVARAQKSITSVKRARVQHAQRYGVLPGHLPPG